MNSIHFIFTTFVGLLIAVDAGPHYPVILVPGDGGSQLVVKLNKTVSKHWYCSKSTGGAYTSLWVNLEEFTPGFQVCFVDNMVLLYDNKTRTTYSPQGIDIKTVGFGDTQSVEWLDPSSASHLISSVSYFYSIVSDLVGVGYKRNVSVRGAPFDFRRAPNEMGQYFKDLKQLIEETYILNNKTRCVMVAHSMGNPVLLYFLNKQTQQWKDQYIQSHVALSGPWAGAVKTLRLYASGDSLGVVVVSPNTVRPEQRSMPSTAFLMPSDKFWDKDVLVQTPDRNYTVHDYKQYFHDVGFMEGWEMRKDTEKLVYDLDPPGVRVHCIHGSEIPTPGTLVFPKGAFPDKFPDMIADDGDGTVNMRSLLACVKWVGKQKAKVSHSIFPKAEHMEILSDPRARKYILGVATGQIL